MEAELKELLDAYTRNLLAGEDEIADGIRGKIEALFLRAMNMRSAMGEEKG